MKRAELWYDMQNGWWELNHLEDGQVLASETSDRLEKLFPEIADLGEHEVIRRVLLLHETGVLHVGMRA